jgi:voltage-gated potassium channel
VDKWNRKIIVAVTLIASFLLFGTLFFHFTEGWSYVDSFYFSGITLTTVGYGDFMPTQPLTKLVTVFFAFAGIGIVFYSIGIIAQKYFEREEERLQSIWESARTARTARQTARDVRSKAKMIETMRRDSERTAALLKR